MELKFLTCLEFSLLANTNPSCWNLSLPATAWSLVTRKSSVCYPCKNHPHAGTIPGSGLLLSMVIAQDLFDFASMVSSFSSFIILLIACAFSPNSISSVSFVSHIGAGLDDRSSCHAKLVWKEASSSYWLAPANRTIKIKVRALLKPELTLNLHCFLILCLHSIQFRWNVDFPMEDFNTGHVRPPITVSDRHHDLFPQPRNIYKCMTTATGASPTPWHYGILLDSRVLHIAFLLLF